MSTKPEYLDELMAKAKDAAGSDYKLAKLLETPRSAISMWKSGVRTCPIGDQVLMAQIAGLKPDEWLARAVVEQYAGTSKGEKLYRALGKALAATGGAIISSGADAHPIFSIAEKGVTYFIRCIEVLTERRRYARS